MEITRKFLTLLSSILVSASAFSDTLILEDKDDCCEKNPIEINLTSSNSVDGITINGVLNATMIGDILNNVFYFDKLLWHYYHYIHFWRINMSFVMPGTVDRLK